MQTADSTVKRYQARQALETIGKGSGKLSDISGKGSGQAADSSRKGSGKLQTVVGRDLVRQAADSSRKGSGRLQT